MTLNWIGVIVAAATFSSVWLGHVGVRKIEAHSPTLWLPMIAALALGLGSEVGALLSKSLYLSGTLGIFGAMLLWDALEFIRQHKRVERGHAPANPANPRHARLLVGGTATTVDWLAREPQGSRSLFPARERMGSEG